MKHVLTRAELHDMVWTRAVSKVAPELGISDVALRKQCVKHKIPLPDSRYWGLFHAGKPVERVPLPEANDVPDRVVIHGSQHEPLPADIIEAVERVRAAAKPVEIPDRLHKLAAATVSLAKHRARDGDGVVVFSEPDVFAVRAHRDTLDRLGDFLNRLVRHALARGYHFESGKHGMVAVVEGERIAFKINQTIRRTHHVATQEEQAKVARWDARHGNSWSRWEGRPTIPYWDYTPTGAMALEIDGWLTGCQRRFADSKATKLEQRVETILDAFHAWALGLKRQRDEARLEAVAAEQRRQRRIEEAKLEALEQCRADYLLRLAEQMDERDKAKRVLIMLEQAGEGAEAYASWLRGHIEQLSLGLAAASMMDELERREEAAGREAAAKLASPFYR